MFKWVREGIYMKIDYKIGIMKAPDFSHGECQVSDLGRNEP